jgi:hypothetical protein
VILSHQQGPDQANGGITIGKDTEQIGSALDLWSATTRPELLPNG